MPDPLSRFLCRSIVFQEPDRVVHPPSWLEHIPFAFWIVDVLRPGVFVELGTQSGNSYAAFAQAVQILGLSSAAYAVDSWRGDSQTGFYDESVYEEWARYHDRRFSSFSRLVRSTFDEAATHFADGTIDLLHIDGCHTYEAVSADFALWRPKLSPRGVVLLHDVNVRERDFGAWRFWEELQTQVPSFKFLHGHGLGVLGIGPELPEALHWLFTAGRSAEESRVVRQFFARLGTGVSSRLVLQQLEVDVTQREQVVSGLTSEVAQLRPRLNTVSAERDHLQHQVERHVSAERELAAARADLAIWRKTAEERTHLASELHQRVARESARLNTVAGQARTQPAAGQQTRKAVTGLSGLSLLAHPRRARDARIVRSSSLFDPEYYLASCPDVSRSGLSPLHHFVLHGAFEGRSPHPLFDTAYYLRRNSDVAAARVNALVHYRRRGSLERRNPHPLFDVAFYLDANPDVAAAGVEPLAHFLEVGAAEGRNPNPFFDCSYYLTHHPEVRASKINPLVHFATEGWRAGNRPSEGFDPQYYTARYSDIGAADENPLGHFLEYGRLEGRAPRGEGADPGGRSLTTLLGTPATRMTVRSLASPEPHRRTVLCVSPFVPLPDLGGNEYRVHKLLRWLRHQGYRVVPVIAPLPDQHLDEDVVTRVAAEFLNAVFCYRDGRLDYVLEDLPDVLSSLANRFATPASLLVDEAPASAAGELDPTGVDRAVCHDALITALLRLHPVLGRYVVLAESIWMCRVLPLLSGDVVKAVDTLHPIAGRESLAPATSALTATPYEHRVRLQHADLVLALDDEQRVALERLLRGKAVVTVGVDCDIVTDARADEGRRIVCAMPDTADNRSGLSDFFRFAWPRLRRDVPDAELVLPGRIGEGFESIPGVVRPAHVDWPAIYQQARVAISPSPVGASLRREVLQALAHGCPVVTWPGGRCGVPPALSALCIAVHDWFEFAGRLSALIHEESSASYLPADVHEIARLTSPGVVYQPLLDAVEHLSEPSRRTGAEADVRSRARSF